MKGFFYVADLSIVYGWQLSGATKFVNTLN